MAALTDLSNYLNLITGGNGGNPQSVDLSINNFYQSTANTSISANAWTSLWRYNKTRGSYGTAPTSATIPINTTPGGIMQVDAAVGKTLYLAGVSAVNGQDTSWMLYDRLLHNGGLSGTVLTAQTVGGVLTRNTTGAGNRIFIEIYDTAIGATARTATVSYTNSLGVAGRSGTCTIGGTLFNEIHRMIPVTLQQGDLGVRSVESVTISATTGTAGNFGITIAKMAVVGGSGLGWSADFLTGLGFPFPITAGACLALAVFCQPAAVTTFRADFQANFFEN